MKKLISLLAVSSALLLACGMLLACGSNEAAKVDDATETVVEDKSLIVADNEAAKVDDATETVVEDKSLIVAESAEETAQNVADRYDYEMVEPVPKDSNFGIVDYWEFDKKHVVYANPDGGLLYVGGAGLTKEEALDLINNEDFPVTEELQSILDATSIDDFIDDGVSSEYLNAHNGITLAVGPQITSEDDVLFKILLSTAR